MGYVQTLCYLYKSLEHLLTLISAGVPGISPRWTLGKTVLDI
jgi:hypothetical protein